MASDLEFFNYQQLTDDLSDEQHPEGQCNDGCPRCDGGHGMELKLNRVECKWELIDGDTLVGKGDMTADGESLIINAGHVFNLIKTINALQEHADGGLRS